MLENRIRRDLREAMLNRDRDRADTLKMILSETCRLKDKVHEKSTDEEIHKVIRKLIKSEKLILEYSGTSASSSTYIRTLEKYLPKMMEEQEIKKWILDNIDISAYNNTIKATGKVMKMLKGKADGKTVQRALISFQ